MRKGNMTILASILAIILVAIGVGAGTMAYFSDTETSENNIFTAGTLDLTKDTVVGLPVSLTNMAPGDSVSGSITLKNVGTLDGKLYGRTTYVEKDGPTNPDDKTADQFAAKLMVTSWQEPGMGSPINPGISVYTLVTANPTTPVTVQDHGVWQYYGTLAKDATAFFAMTVQFDTSAGNGYQGDGIEVKFEYLLVQTNHPTS